jgi:sugar/nucleoside kinase (ribokinase family)
MSPASGHVEIISAGRVTVDYGIGPGGEVIVERPGGSALYAAVGARLWNDHVGLLGRVGAHFPDGWLARFETQGLSTKGIRMMDEPYDHRDAYVYTSATERTSERLADAYRAHGRSLPPELEGFVPYTDQKEDRSRFAPLAVRPSETPRSYLHARAAHVAPCELVTQTALPAALRRSGLSYITLAPHSRFMKPEFTVDVKQVVLGLDAFIPRDSDVRSFFEEAGLQEDVWQAAEAFAAMGARSVVIRQGLRGLSVYDARQHKRWHVQAYTAKVKEPTGAGDAFAGGFVAGLLAHDDILEAALCGSVSASLAMEGTDPFYVLGSTPGLAEARREALRGGVRDV